MRVQVYHFSPCNSLLISSLCILSSSLERVDVVAVDVEGACPFSLAASSSLTANQTISIKHKSALLSFLSRITSAEEGRTRFIRLGPLLELIHIFIVLLLLTIAVLERCFLEVGAISLLLSYLSIARLLKLGARSLAYAE